MSRLRAATVLTASVMITMTACSGSVTSPEKLRGTIRLDGSSTVAPLSELAGEFFVEENLDVRVTVGTSGTGPGFERLCSGEIDISDASRPITAAEVAACAKAGIEYAEIGVANDGIAVAVNRANDWATCLTIEELSRIWARDSDIDNWSQVRDGFPDEALILYGPGDTSGTLDYFTEVVNGEEGSIRSDYNDIGEDDHAAVTGIAGATGAMGYIPLSFVKESEGSVKPIQVENESGTCVGPADRTVRDGSYSPLGRQLFVYPSSTALQREEVSAFLTFYIENSDRIAAAADFIPLTEDQKLEAQRKVDALLDDD